MTEQIPKKQGMVLFVLTTFLFLFAIGPAIGFGQETTQDDSPIGRWCRTKADRRKEAGKWLKDVLEIEKQIPTLSPAEKEWLREEIDEEVKARGGGYSSARARRARDSTEYRCREVKGWLQEMASILDLLSNASDLSTSREVMLWTRVAYIAINQPLWDSLIELWRRGVIVGKGNESFAFELKELLLWIWDSRAMEILRGITLPHIEATVRK